MKPIFHGFVILLSVIGLIILTSFVYSQYLVDNSLQGLELTLATVSEQDSFSQSGTDRHAYRNILQGLVMDEAGKEDVNFKNLSFLELALRSFDEASEKGGYGKAQIYLEQVRQAKISERSIALRILDHLNVKLKKWFSTLSFTFGGRNQLYAPESSDIDEAYEYSGLPLLDEAHERERRGEYAQAETLYRNYLKINFNSHSKSWIQISLAFSLMNQKKFSEAEGILREVVRKDAGLREAEIASNFLRQIEQIKKVETRLKQNAELDQQGKALDEGSRFKLGLGYMTSYDYDLAKKSFESLRQATQKDIRERSIFYLGMILKMTNQLEESRAIVRELLANEDLDRDLNLALNVQLADIYYRSEQLDKSLSVYDNLLVQSYGDSTLQENLRNAWMALAELEKASIYFFDMKNSRLGGESLEKMDEFIPDFFKFTSVLSSFYNQSPEYLRNLAFISLQQGRVRSAYDLLKRSLDIKENDPWALSGFATAALLLGKVDQGLNYAQRGYQTKADEYTCSVLAYVYEIMGNNAEAEKIYNEALIFNESFLPARFNIAIVQKRQGKFQEAMAQLKKLSDDLMDANKIIRAKTFVNLGCVLYDLNRVKEAVESFRRSLSLMPEFEIARKNLAALNAEKFS